MLAANPHTPGNAHLHNQQCLCCMCGHDLIKLYTATSAVDSILFCTQNLASRLHSESRLLCCTCMHKAPNHCCAAGRIDGSQTHQHSVSVQPDCLALLQAASADTLCSLQQLTVVCPFGTTMLLSCCHENCHMNVGMFCLASNLVESVCSISQQHLNQDRALHEPT